MALNAFVSGSLWEIWELPKSHLKSKYPNAKDFGHLLNFDLKELKKCISELCEQLKLKPLHEEYPKLWSDLLQIVKTTRDFMTHPTPEASEFNEIVGKAIKNMSGQFQPKSWSE